MKIIKYSKQKNGNYKVYLDDNTFIILHEEVILKNELLLKKSIDNIEELINQSKKYELLNICMKYISKKLRSVKEIKVFLQKEQVNDIDSEWIINELLQKNYLNDKIFSRSYINDRINLSNDGPKKIIMYLEKEDIAKDVYEEYLDLFTKDLIYEKINKYINKQIKTNKKSKYILKNKIIFNLTNLGYEKGDIISCLELVDDIDDSDNKKMQYEKVYNKLKKKYSGQELERKVKEKLYQMGYFE